MKRLAFMPRACRRLAAARTQLRRALGWAADQPEEQERVKDILSRVDHSEGSTLSAQ